MVVVSEAIKWNVGKDEYVEIPVNFIPCLTNGETSVSITDLAKEAGEKDGAAYLLSAFIKAGILKKTPQISAWNNLLYTLGQQGQIGYDSHEAGYVLMPTEEQLLSDKTLLSLVVVAENAILTPD